MTNIAKELAESFATSGVQLAYGKPIEAVGTTIIPVAAVSYGFGAGEGGAEGTPNEGSGGGGGGMAIPVGAYITSNGKTWFEPNPVTLAAIGIPFVCVAGWAVARVVKALKS